MVADDEKLWQGVNRKRQRADTYRRISQMVGRHRHGESHSHLSDYQLVKGLAREVFVLEDVSGRSVTHDTVLLPAAVMRVMRAGDRGIQRHKVLPETCIKSRRCGSTTKRITWCEVFSAG